MTKVSVQLVTFTQNTTFKSIFKSIISYFTRPVNLVKSLTVWQSDVKLSYSYFTPNKYVLLLKKYQI